MYILFIAPQPFYQERGTPIAVKLAVEVLGAEHKIDLLTYAEGNDIKLPIQNHYRTKDFSFLRKMRPGFSLKKCFADFLILIEVIKLLRTKKYDLLHCVEESAFIGLFVKVFYKVPYIYDMDSSLSIQIIERFKFLCFLKPIFEFFEKLIIKHSLAVIAVCDSLVSMANNFKSKKTYLLSDVSLLEENQDSKEVAIKEELGIDPKSLVGLYVGNLEKYQGVELLVQAFNNTKDSDFHLAIIGGNYKDIANIKGLVLDSKKMHIHFLGSRPVSLLKAYLDQADILFSPRIHGNNTPMKIYSYLHAGKALIATNLPTHTQVLNSEIAYLVEPNAISLSNGIENLISNMELRTKLALNAKNYAEKNHTFKIFKYRLENIYLELKEKLS